MGGRVASRLLDAGHDLTVWNRSPEKADELVAAGARRAGSPAEAARAADVVLIMVADPAALAAVSEGEDGIAAGAAGTTVLDLSTVGLEAVERLADALPADAELLDAPVLGSLPEAEEGALRIFVGGSAAAYERVRPLLEALGTPLHAGPPGSGAAAKLVANATLFGVLGLLGESLALADGLGLERGVAFEILALTPLAATAERRRPAIETGEYPTRFTLSLALKDAELVRAAAARTGLDLRLAEASRSWLADAEAVGFGDEDYAAALRVIAG